MCGDKIDTAGEDSGPGRRRFLCGVGLAVAGAVAGCSNVTDQSFSASRAGLSETAREELALEQVDSESRSLSREGPSGNVEVTITNHAAIYSRAAGMGGS